MKNLKNLFFTTVLSSALILSASSLSKAGITELHQFASSEGIDLVGERPLDRKPDWLLE